MEEYDAAADDEQVPTPGWEQVRTNKNAHKDSKGDLRRRAKRDKNRGEPFSTIPEPRRPRPLWDRVPTPKEARAPSEGDLKRAEKRRKNRGK